jgi:GntR family transcriptional repressor for pyruvate dehydrogenase complex
MEEELLSKIQRSRSKPELLIQRILDSISAGELRPGDKLPSEDTFAAKIGIGKSSVHEAMKILEAFGIVEIYTGMLDPFFYGMLLNARSQRDIAEWKVKNRELVVMSLLELRCADQTNNLEQFRQAAYTYHPGTQDTISAQLQFLESMELQLCSLVDNPMIREQYRLAVRISSSLQSKAVKRKFETGNGFWFPEFFREIADYLLNGNKSGVRRLIREEYSSLLCGLQ